MKAKLIAYWITTILGPGSFVIGGVLNLKGGDEMTTGMNHLGYAPYFGKIIGFWMLAGAIVTLLPGLPRLKEWAYAGFVFLLTGAAASHAFAGDPFLEKVVPPLGFLAIVVASWALRPASRRLPGPVV